MKVYGVYSGCIYEGGGVGQMFSDKEKCVKACKNLVRSKSRAQRELYKNETIWKPDPWRKERGIDNYWHNKADCVTIQEFDVID